MPTISSALRSENSIFSSVVSSPPNTRCKSCRALVFAPSCAAMIPFPIVPSPRLAESASEVYAARALDELGGKLWRGRDQARKTGDRQIEAEGMAVMVGDHAASLLDQQHTGGQIPFAFGGERYGRVGAPGGDQRQPVGD